MRIPTRTCVFGALLVTVLAAAGPAWAEPSSGLVVRLYNSAGASAEDLEMATRVAGPILREIGVEVTFRQCHRIGPAHPAPDRCNDRLTPSEVVVRVIDAPHFDLALNPATLGVAYVVSDTDRGWLATVYRDRVAAKASHVAIDRGTLLGRVIAHEVGHLLLGMRYHGDTGVMRADWPEETLQSSATADWRFSAFELETMQRALLARVH